MCDHTDGVITTEITEAMTLREALPRLEDAWDETRKAVGAQSGHYFIEGLEWLESDDGTPVLYMHLGT